MTLEEHDALLKAEGRHDAMVDRHREQENERQTRAAEWRRAEAPLIEELREAGLAVASVWDLVNSKAGYSKALPVLLKHLQRDYPVAVREGIARALAVPEGKFAWSELTRLYRQEQDNLAKDGLAVAIAAVSDDEVIGDVIDLAQDTKNGASRLLLLSALERSRDPRARAALMRLGTDSQLRQEVQVILRRLRRSSKR